MNIAIVDYNGGNTASMKNALARLGFSAVVTSDPPVILSADKIIFPGQGRAGSAMQNLRETGLDVTVQNIKRPFLGVCLGMQLLFEDSEEDNTKCLGIIKGTVKRFRELKVKVPQIGWNTITETRNSPLLKDMPDTFYAYFVNSYYAETERRYVIGMSSYGATMFPSVVQQDNFFGVQFHPEKSGDIGQQLLRNFCELGIPTPHTTLVIPALDIRGGNCVRLRQGNYEKETFYSDSPCAVARSFAGKGAKYLHLIDLDGAKKGEPVNSALILSIAKEMTIPIQVGGGIRTLEHAKEYLDGGVERIIVSTAALNNPEMMRKVIAEYGAGRIIVSVDVKNTALALEGWQQMSTTSIDAALRELTELGIETIIYTDIQKDGTLGGLNLNRIREILKKPFRVMVAGGVKSIQDIHTLRDSGAYGVIVGKALYENAVDLKKANEAVPAPAVFRRAVRPAQTVTKRIIACMDIAGGRVVKGVRFRSMRDAGDPALLGRYYSESGADELVLLDITATLEERKTLYALIERVAKNITIPFTVGGGVETIEDIKRLLNAGADKVSIGSAAVKNPDLVTQAAKEFGSQCIVISIDPKQKGDSWELYTKGGREASGVDTIAFCKDMQKRGAGELLVNSLDRDGTKAGYDCALLRSIANAVSIPLVASSGAGSKEDFLSALTIGGADAVLAASLFNQGVLRIQEVKAFLGDNNIAIRP